MLTRFTLPDERPIWLNTQHVTLVTRCEQADCPQAVVGLLGQEQTVHLAETVEHVAARVNQEALIARSRREA